ncbi:MAG TPA: ABATE domain-containing protein, partial [Gemmatimonadaceae bacterium]|nr:ABATE domain-containing protein [Gemmatimonadaceae bacterium]
MATSRMAEREFQRIGGHPVLDFHNTITWTRAGTTHELLESVADLVAWIRGSGVVTDAEWEQLARDAAHDPERSARTLHQARELRAVLHDLLSAAAAARAPDAERLAEFNGVLRRALALLDVAWEGDGFTWRIAGAMTHERAENDGGPRVRGDGAMMLDVALARVVWSAAQLLTAGNLVRLRQCANADCGWLFLDTTRNWSRRWCSMADCGSRDKARRYYQRKRARTGRGREQGSG